MILSPLSKYLWTTLCENWIFGNLPIFGLREVSFKKKHFDGLNPQWGGGVSVRIHFSRIFFYF